MTFRICLKNGDEMTADFPSKTAALAWLDECGYMRAKPVMCGSIDRNGGNAIRLWYAMDEAVQPVGVRL